MITEPITLFRGPWTRLSNYSLCSVWYDDHMYPSTEHAYQAAKFHSETLQEEIRDAATPAISKRIARKYEKAGLCRLDWHEVKTNIMRVLLHEKFSQEPEKQVLLATRNRELVEGNWWHDNFWGDCGCAKCKDIPGENTLGKLLMELRAELRASSQYD